MAFITPLKMNAQAANVTQTVKIKTSAECDMCKSRIEKEVRAMKGVKSADLDLTTKILTVEYNPKKISPENIRTAISNIGYDADDVKANNRSQKELPKCCHPPKN
ncbi:MAG: heavy-metal-associated domain-containing protein [Bacteroidetes bacterium]|nr:heavy-metal-associated domain-containing protein [Bacteroidota bacterium]